MDSHLLSIVDEAMQGKVWSASDIRLALSYPVLSPESFHMQHAARRLGESLAAGEIHGQVGINTGACPCNCKFCSFSAENRIFGRMEIKSNDETIRQVRQLLDDGANAIYLMTTANFEFEKFLGIGADVRKEIGQQPVLVANIGDIDRDQASSLKKTGFNGVYHALRMGEGQDSGIKPEVRKATVEAARLAGLKVGTCVEPVGPEHSVDEIIDKIIFAREMEPVFSGAMRRISLPGTALAEYGMCSEARMAQIVAVVRLATGHSVLGNCTHEPNVHSAVAGAGVLWAEAGANPRDTDQNTENNRGFTVEKCFNVFKEAEYPVLDGPSLLFAE